MAEVRRIVKLEQQVKRSQVCLQVRPQSHPHLDLQQIKLAGGLQFPLPGTQKNRLWTLRRPAKAQTHGQRKSFLCR